MTFSIVLTKEGSSQLISLVPSTWINQNNILFWPRTKKNSDLELLRRDENSIPSKNWKKINCKIKLQGITTFAEGLKLEELYSNFEDTEDEERFIINRQINRNHPEIKSVNENLLDVNSDFEMENKENHVTSNHMSNESADAKMKTSMKENALSEFLNYASPSSEVLCGTKEIEVDTKKNNTTSENMPLISGAENEDCITMNLTAFNQILAENSGLHIENKMLKASLEQFENLKENEHSFKKIQVQLDKIFDVLKSNKSGSSAITFETAKIDEQIAQYNIKFPIDTVQLLNFLEDKLSMVEFEKALISKFSTVCGTSGKQKLSKVGLQLARSLFTDELLCQFTWKGIKGCTKVPFINYIKIRHLFFKTIQLADSSCSAQDSDSFLQNSAIKHSGQRIKRKYSNLKVTNPKKKKIETENNNTTGNEEQPSSNCSATEEINDNSNQENINENDGLQDKENEMVNTPETRKSVTILSDVKITNKILDLKHKSKMMNISFDDLRNVFDK